MSKIKLKKISIDGGTQPRENIDEDLVSEYAADMQEGDDFPAIILFNDGANYWLADGFHRYHASKKVGFLEIKAEVKNGTKRDAILYSVSANGKHGKRRTNADKRKAVETLLNDEEWSQWSTREIARQCEVSVGMVSKYRNEPSVQDEQMERRVKRGDQEYTVDTSNIGNGQSKNFKQTVDEVSERHKGSLEKLANTDIDPETGEVLEDDSGDGLKTYFKESNGRGSAVKMGIEQSWKKAQRESFEQAQQELDSDAMGLVRAERALQILKDIPVKDPERDEALNMVNNWINKNR